MGEEWIVGIAVMWVIILIVIIFVNYTGVYETPKVHINIEYLGNDTYKLGFKTVNAAISYLDRMNVTVLDLKATHQNITEILENTTLVADNRKLVLADVIEDPYKILNPYTERITVTIDGDVKIDEDRLSTKEIQWVMGSIAILLFMALRVSPKPRRRWK